MKTYSKATWFCTPHCNDDFNKIIVQVILMADISYGAY